MKKHPFFYFFLFLVIFLRGIDTHAQESHPVQKPNRFYRFLHPWDTTGRINKSQGTNKKARQTKESHSKDIGSKETSSQEIPSKVLTVLKYVRIHHEAPEGFVGSRRFGNYEGRLPVVDSAQNKISYQEWDVNPHLRGVNRGAERLITGSNNKAWYTPNHYQTFIEIKDVY